MGSWLFAEKSFAGSSVSLPLSVLPISVAHAASCCEVAIPVYRTAPALVVCTVNTYVSDHMYDRISSSLCRADLAESWTVDWPRL